MTIWQADFYRRPLQDAAGNALWELLVCNPTTGFSASALCPQTDANAAWLTNQLKQLAERAGGTPQRIQVFRPQSVSLLQAACQPLGIAVEPTRRTPALKQLLRQQATQYPPSNPPYDPLQLDSPPPVPLPESLWGDQWRFATIAALDLLPAIQNRPIPIRELPEELLPVNLQLPSTISIPGVVIDGGRQAMALARWMQRSRPVALTYIPGDPDGLILEAGLVERWVLTTFTDPEVINAARSFRDRQAAAKGLHFLLIQPDDSGRTYTGFWLLQWERD
ncbi:MAG: Tab2/Atab2 family RNA-binding protein [Synechococcales cyanobacterium C42_A2020_086]|jgi:hypothetical protein|nr:Tab2/Atab2 family RNA-binding protein [Synechococcales cyanobacterium M58_A2018_015]MBF2074930.1 Tab2/Atab2 family RNA-binding protein [Synechococcales cyanobacterium C42_A2020_086]